MKKTTKKKKQYIKYSCFPFEQGKHELVFFVANAKEIWEVVDINKREEDKDKGYQRALSESRMRTIAKYVDDGNCIPLSILISFDYAQIKNGEILIEKRSNAGWVIDGQHRLAGAHKAKKDFFLPIIAFLNLDLDEQIKQFIIINKEAKGVPTSLYYDLLHCCPIKF